MPGGRSSSAKNSLPGRNCAHVDGVLKKRTPVARLVGGLVNVAADDAANFGVRVDDAPERRGVAQRDAVEPRAAHRQRVVMHRHQHVLGRVRGERLAQALQTRGPEAAGVFAGEERAEQHDRPRAVPQLAAELERAAREDLAHELRVVVVAGNRVDGYAERLERGAEAFVTGAALVLHDVARGEDRVDGPAPVALRVLEHGEERRVRRHAAHAAVRSRVQVRIADLQDA